ncbi:hypothetical protein ACJMK2_005440 [Sinanodonta woodiana]|uniref:Uncharacterized protein n=1 Tax=Sinanodonta woodiana TaxID=1069815 RepID=A0ABD3VSR5_SINWO
MWCVCKARKSSTIDRWKNPFLNTIIKLKNIYATQRIRDDDLEMELEFEGRIPGFFSGQRQTKLRLGKKSFKKTLIEVYNKTSTAINIYSMIFLAPWRNCTASSVNYNIGILSENAHIHEYVSRSVMTHEFLWRESESLRYARDFVILRDTLDLFLE